MQTRSTPLRPGLPSPAVLLFKCPIRVLCQLWTGHLWMLTMMMITLRHLWKDEQKLIRNVILAKNPVLSCRVYCSGSVRRQETMNPWNHDRQPQPQWLIMQIMSDKDWVASHQNSKHARIIPITAEIPQGSAVWGQKEGYTKEHSDDTVITWYGRVVCRPNRLT